MKKILSILLLCICAACSSNKNKHVEIEQVSAEILYEKGEKDLEKGDYKDALKNFNRVAYEYPYHNLAAKAQVMEVYTNYLMGEYDLAVVVADQYVKLHPANSEVPYVLYLKALSYYNQIDIPYRDQENTYQAKKAFLHLMKRFPNSQYARDVKVKLELVNDHIAAHEMIVGRFYLSRGSILSAIKRFQKVVESYSRTSHIEEALYRLVESYNFLGLKDEARKNAAVLGHNYPASKWYRESYNIVQN